MPSQRHVPPLFGSLPSAPFTSFLKTSQSLSSTGARTWQPKRSCNSIVEPTWSPWPCVSAIRSTRSGSFSFSGHFGLPSRNGST